MSLPCGINFIPIPGEVITEIISEIITEIITDSEVERRSTADTELDLSTETLGKMKYNFNDKTLLSRNILRNGCFPL